MSGIKEQKKKNSLPSVILFGLIACMLYGAGALAFGLILTSAIHFVGRGYAMIISGMLNAAAGMVGFILSPVLQSLLQARGLVFTLAAMIGIVAALIPVAVIITSWLPDLPHADSIW